MFFAAANEALSPSVRCLFRRAAGSPTAAVQLLAVSTGVCWSVPKCLVVHGYRSGRRLKPRHEPCVLAFAIAPESRLVSAG